MKFDKTVRLTMSERQFILLREIVSESCDLWRKQMNDEPPEHQQAATIMWRDRDAIRSSFDDYYRNNFILNS